MILPKCKGRSRRFRWYAFSKMKRSNYLIIAAIVALAVLYGILFAAGDLGDFLLQWRR